MPIFRITIKIHEMKHLILILIITFLLTSSTLPSFAHEGHGHTEGHTLIHYLSEPIHLAGVLTILLGFVLLFRWRKSIVKQKTKKDA